MDKNTKKLHIANLVAEYSVAIETALKDLEENTVDRIEALRLYEDENSQIGVTLSQVELCDISGIDSQVYNKIRTKKNRPTIKHLVILSKVFGVSLDYLVSGNSNDVNKSKFDFPGKLLDETLIHISGLIKGAEGIKKCLIDAKKRLL